MGNKLYARAIVTVFFFEGEWSFLVFFSVDRAISNLFEFRFVYKSRVYPRKPNTARDCLMFVSINELQWYDYGLINWTPRMG